VKISPDGPVIAGSIGQWTIQYTVGSYGIDEGGTIKIARRFASDEERPQFDDPSAPAYTSVVTDGEAKLAARYDPKAHVRPWMKCVVIDVYDGCLAPGDLVTVTFGDQSHGSPGIRTQSFIESEHEVRVLVDPTNACLVRRLPSSPSFPIISGDPVRLVVIVPTTIIAGEAVEVFVKGEDMWGNPTPSPPGVSLSWEGEANASIEGMTLVAGGTGTGTVVARWRDAQYESNPAMVHDGAPQLSSYWAELHAQSDATVGTGSESEYFAFGRDWARVDVMSHQGNDFQVTDRTWEHLNRVVRDFHEDGRFVVFPGFEWSANTPAGGDRNVIYAEEGMPIFRSSHWQVEGTPEDSRSPAHPADDLYAKLREHTDLAKVVVASHCGGRYADIRRYYDQELEPLVEVASCWGVFEWLLWDAFDHDYVVGIMCNSDGHKGRPGAEGPGAGQFGIYGGLTCILAKSLTRASIFEALKERRCYGTTGPRMDLRFEVDGAPMGSVLSARPRARVEGSVTGTAPIEALVLYRGKRVEHVFRPEAFANATSSKRVRLMWGGARIRGRGRRAVWDGRVEVEGARILRARTVAFDSPADGIESDGESAVILRSRTTGDVDGLDLWLNQAEQGRVTLHTGIGQVSVDLSQLDVEGVTERFGGLDLHARVARYPENPRDRTLAFSVEVELPGDERTPLFVKAIQTDGEMAWSSPVYLG
jgi:hypothetical protein